MEPNSEKKIDNFLASTKRGAKILGASAIGGVIGYATSKGLETILPIPINNEDFFEGAVVATYTWFTAYIAEDVL